MFNIKGTDTFTFDCGDPKYSTKLGKSLEELANYLQYTQVYYGRYIGALFQAMEILDFFVPEVEKYVQQMGCLQQKI